MRLPDFRAVRTVLRKELRETLRDRRTLFVMVFIPILLYPLLIIGFSMLSLGRVRDLRAAGFPIAVTVDARPVAGAAGGGSGSGELLGRLLGDSAFVLASDAGDPGEALREGRIALHAEIPADIEDALLSAGPAGREIRVRFDSSNDRSRAAEEAFARAVRRFSEERSGILVTAMDLASDRGRWARAFGGLLAMMIVLMALTGAFYPAVDIVAGEKERGTLETLLLSGAGRTELVLGKYLAVATVSLCAAVLNLGSLAASLSQLASLAASAGGSAPLSVGTGVLGVIALVLVPTVAVLSALALALSTCARSYKEGQHYLTPLFVLVMPLAMAGTLPNVELTAELALVPVVNVVLLVKELIRGDVVAVHIVLTVLSLSAVAAACLQWSVSLFQREDVLMREGRGLLLFRRPPDCPAPERPAAGAGVVLWLVLVIGLVFGAGRLGAGDPILGHIVAMGLVGGLPLLFLRSQTFPLLRTLRIGLPNVRSLTGALLAAAGGRWLANGILALQGDALGSRDAHQAALREAVRPLLEAPLPVALVLVALLPAVAEEIFFRGFLGAAFRVGRSAVPGILAASALFALLHLAPPQFPYTFALGVVLSLLVARSGTLVTAVVAHAAFNALNIVLARFGDTLSSLPVVGRLAAEETGGSWAEPLLTGLVLVAGGVLLCGRRRGQRAAS